MADTVVSQTRNQLLNSDGDLVYRVISVVTDKGDLPHQFLFVTTINDNLDPTADTFLRVATPYDLTNLNTDRATAVSEDATVYLSAFVSNDYSDLEIAMQARQEIDGRVNTLVTTWQAYYSSFYTPTAETLTFPNADESYTQELKTAYSDAKAARVVAEEDLATKTTTLSDAEEDYDDATTQVDMFLASVNFCEKLRDPTHGFWTILKSGISSYEAGNNSLFDDLKTAYEQWSGTPWVLTTAPAPTDDWFFLYNVMYTWYTSIKPAWDTTGAPQVANVDNILTNVCATASSEYASAVSDQSAALADVNTAAQAKEEAAATLAAAQEAEDAALAAVVAVCPDFDPDSI